MFIVGHGTRSTVLNRNIKQNNKGKYECLNTLNDKFKHGNGAYKGIYEIIKCL